MTSPATRRLSAGGRIDRTVTWRFTVDGQEFTGHPGDTLASALLANGRIAAGNSLYEDRPRGIMSAGVEEPNALVKVAPGSRATWPSPMLPATTVALVDGLEAPTCSTAWASWTRPTTTPSTTRSTSTPTSW